MFKTITQKSLPLAISCALVLSIGATPAKADDAKPDFKPIICPVIGEGSVRPYTIKDIISKFPMLWILGVISQVG